MNKIWKFHARYEATKNQFFEKPMINNFTQNYRTDA